MSDRFDEALREKGVDPETVREAAERRALPDHKCHSLLTNNLPRVLPVPWRQMRVRELGEMADASYGRMLFNESTGMKMIVSVAREDDQRIWMHFSISLPDRIPTWEEVRDAKELFTGRDVRAIVIIPPRSQYVNLHSNVLHWFRCMDEDGLPDFSSGTGSL